MTPEEIKTALERANRLQSDGAFAEAASIYEEVLKAEPGRPDALHLLGLVRHKQGDNVRSLELLLQSLATFPPRAEYLQSYAIVLNALARPEEAIPCFQQALEMEPGLHLSHFGLGSALLSVDRLDEAMESFRKTLELKPDYFHACNGLAKAFHQRGDLEEAARWYRKSLEVSPFSNDALANLAGILKELGRLEDAVGEARRQADSKPDDFEAHYRLGALLAEGGKWEEAFRAYGRAREIKPEDPEALLYSGSMLMKLERVPEAKACFEALIRLKPRWAHAHGNYGFMLLHEGKTDGALGCFRRAIELNPADSGLHSSLLLVASFSDGLTPREVFEEHRQWAARHADPLTPAHPSHANLPDPHRRLRVGYLSPDYRRHVNAIAIEPLLRLHDRRAFEIYCYDCSPCVDEVTLRLKSLADHWRVVGKLGHDQVAQMIRQDGIDILVELAGHTDQNQLPVLARRPAPVQVNYLGYPNTTGMLAVDYRITDMISDPPGMTEGLHTEKLVRLPHSFVCYNYENNLPRPAPLPMLKNGHITFGSTNTTAKLNDGVLEDWARVLKAVPDARLLIRALPLSSPVFRDEMVGRFQRFGIPPGRLELRGWVKEGVLTVYHEMDVMLDPFPFNGGRSTYDSFWMGVPIIALEGNTFASRMGIRNLDCVGLRGFSARTPEEYVQRAVEWSGRPSELAEIRASLPGRVRRSPMMDAPHFIAAMESAYRRMWARWCEGKPPEAFSP